MRTLHGNPFSTRPSPSPVVHQVSWHIQEDPMLPNTSCGFIHLFLLPVCRLDPLPIHMHPFIPPFTLIFFPFLKQAWFRLLVSALPSTFSAASALAAEPAVPALLLWSSSAWTPPLIGQLVIPRSCKLSWSRCSLFPLSACLPVTLFVYRHLQPAPRWSPIVFPSLPLPLQASTSPFPPCPGPTSLWRLQTNHPIPLNRGGRIVCNDFDDLGCSVSDTKGEIYTPRKKKKKISWLKPVWVIAKKILWGLGYQIWPKYKLNMLLSSPRIFGIS